MGLASLREPFVKFADQRVEADRGQNGHVENGPDGATTTPNTTFPAKFTAVAVHRGNADKSGYLTTAQVPKLGKVCKQLPRQHLANAWNTPQQRVLLPP